MLKAKRWGREWVLYQLLRLEPLTHGQAMAITGWVDTTFKRAIEHASRPRGAVARDWSPSNSSNPKGCWVYRAKTDDELRRLPARKKRRALVSVQSRVRHVRCPLPVVPATHAAAAAAKARAAAKGASRLDGLWPCGGAAANNGHAGLAEVVAC